MYVILIGYASPTLRLQPWRICCTRFIPTPFKLSLSPQLAGCFSCTNIVISPTLPSFWKGSCIVCTLTAQPLALSGRIFGMVPRTPSPCPLPALQPTLPTLPPLPPTQMPIDQGCPCGVAKEYDGIAANFMCKALQITTSGTPPT